MKKFILKSLLFILPYTFLFLLMTKLYSLNKGDLIRIGYIIDLFPSYGECFEDDYSKPKRYTAISEKTDKKVFQILAIGDSFSEQSSFGYKNQLAHNVDLLYIDRFLSIDNNPVQTLYALIKGDFFDEYKFDYVILESAERAFVVRIDGLDESRTINMVDIFNEVENYKAKENTSKHNFLSNQVSMFLYNSYKFFLNDDYCFENMVCKTKMSRSDLFSIPTNDLLFYIGDLSELGANNNQQKVGDLNLFLNKMSALLKEKQIQLIVLPAPDKYNLYYDYILRKDKYIRPLFFDHLSKENKEYIYIDSKKVLKESMESEKDMYFYDDSHWSPKGAKLIASEILKKIKDPV